MTCQPHRLQLEDDCNTPWVATLIAAQALIKRVIAVDGDRVEIKDGSLFINGEQQYEDYTFEVRRRDIEMFSSYVPAVTTCNTVCRTHCLQPGRAYVDQAVVMQAPALFAQPTGGKTSACAMYNTRSFSPFMWLNEFFPSEV